VAQAGQFVEKPTRHTRDAFMDFLQTRRFDRF
jgi:hypothetical protein